MRRRSVWEVTVTKATSVSSCSPNKIYSMCILGAVPGNGTVGTVHVLTKATINSPKIKKKLKCPENTEKNKRKGKCF